MRVLRKILALIIIIVFSDSILAADNAGPGTVSKYNGVPPVLETRENIEKVLGRFGTAQNPL